MSADTLSRWMAARGFICPDDADLDGLLDALGQQIDAMASGISAGFVYAPPPGPTMQPKKHPEPL